MAKWQAVARGQETGREFVYEVDGPGDAKSEEVVRATLATHGRNIVAGVVDECVQPAVEVTKIT